MNDEPEPEWVDDDSALAGVETELREIGNAFGAGFYAVLSTIVILSPPSLMIITGWYVGNQFRHPFEEIGAAIGVLLGAVFFLGVIEHAED